MHYIGTDIDIFKTISSLLKNKDAKVSCPVYLKDLWNNKNGEAENDRQVDHFLFLLDSCLLTSATHGAKSWGQVEFTFTVCVCVLEGGHGEL